ncbi:MAG: thioredoxin family protein [Rickettsiales bacterium]|nr:thioredoxin family protein [Rickettsiales bacterium]
MVLLSTPKMEKSWKAQDFKLCGVDEQFYNLADVKGTKGLVIVFICNHCPYVKAVVSKIVRDATELKTLGIGFIAINSNDATSFPEDSFENMKEFAKKYNFNFPYVLDESQAIAKKYDAVCTPDFFGFNSDLELQYRGRLDSTRMEHISDAKRELFLAMSEIAKTGEFTGQQMPSMGCSIKWKE